jgi:RNA polymerase sigma-70 factor, ECF subfamily
MEVEPWTEERRVGDVRAEPVSAWRTDRAAAFTDALDAHLDRFFRLAAVILGDRDEADDALSDAALRAWQHIGSLRDPDRFEAWFTRILVNGCRDRLRARRHPAASFRVPDATDDPFSASVERAALRDALASLTPEHRAVIALHHLEGLTVDAIAQRLDLPAGTVKSRLHYGLAELRAAYEAAARVPQGTTR